MPGRRDFLKKAGGAAVVGPMIPSVQIDRQQRDNLPPSKYALLVLDRSGSMNHVREATVKGVNTWLDGIRDESDLFASIVQFDTAGSWGLDSTETFDFHAAKHLPKMTLADYVPRGGTPLLAAVLDGIKRLEAVVRPSDKALLVIQTDGEENTSPPEITLEVVKNLLTAKQAEGNWTVVFMGADIDAWGSSASVGIAPSNTLGYQNNAVATAAAYTTTTGGTQTWSRSINASTTDFFVGVPTTSTAGASVTVKPKRTKKDTSQP